MNPEFVELMCYFNTTTIGTSHDIRVTIRNNQNQALPKGGVLSVNDNKAYFNPGSWNVDEINANEDKSLILTLNVNNLKDIRHIPNTLTLKYTVGGKSSTQSIGLQVSNFIGKFLSLRETKRILVIGVQGSGKSTFINNCVWVLKPELRGNMFAYSGGNFQANTVQLIQYEIKLGNETLKLVDTWGLNNENFNINVVNEMLEGTYPEGTLIDPNDYQITFESDSERIGRADGVLLFVHHSVCSDEVWLGKLRTVCSLICRKNINYKIIISCVDECDKLLRTNIYSQSNTLNQLRNSLVQKLRFGYEIDRVKYYVCITNPMIPEFDKEQNIYDILNDIYSTSIVYNYQVGKGKMKIQ